LRPFEELLSASAKNHGHLCAGQVIGVRMAMLGCRLIGLEDPALSDEEIKRLIVYVEMDRCAADAVSFVTGAKLGRRSLKFMDYGIMAATFVNLSTNEAYRIISTEESRDQVDNYAPGLAERKVREIAAYTHMPDAILFNIQKVSVAISEFDLPGPSRKKAACARCGQVVRDSKEVMVDGRPVCRPCALGAYFKVISGE
jgi:formylmethanofuran dehydrogenase subunit E